jgi:hypothetical protein
MASMVEATKARFQFSLFSLLLCVTSFGIAFGCFRLSSRFGNHLVIEFALFTASGAFWGGGIGALFHRYWRCALIGALLTALIAVVVTRFSSDIVNFFVRFL